MTIILAIESSCDETGVGICRTRRRRHGDAAGRRGGLQRRRARPLRRRRFPKIASRAHLEALGPTHAPRPGDGGRRQARRGRAPTIGPGSGRCALLVGVAAAKAYAAAWQVPFYAVNHLGGHLAADVYDHGPLPESVGLLVSGGHTNLLHVRSLGEPIIELGSTVDDAAGEAYDKIARLLGLGYPGGRVLDDLRPHRGPRRHRLPPRHDRAPRRPVRVQLLRAQDGGGPVRRGATPDASQADVAAGFQEAVADVLTAQGGAGGHGARRCRRC